jgi:mono/diheme cytochrome c family protein
MAEKQTLKRGEKLLFGVFGAFLIAAVIGYAVLESIRLSSDKPMFTIKTHFDLSAEGKQGQQLYNTKGGCSTCHRAMQSGTNMGLSLDGIGSKYSREWIYDFLRDPEKTYRSRYNRQTFDHAINREAAYVAEMPDKDLQLIATYLSELRSDRGSSSAPLPPEGRSEFIDKMIGTWAPESWKKNYQDVRTTSPTEGESAEGAAAPGEPVAGDQGQ